MIYLSCSCFFFADAYDLRKHKHTNFPTNLKLKGGKRNITVGFGNIRALYDCVGIWSFYLPRTRVAAERIKCLRIFVCVCTF